MLFRSIRDSKASVPRCKRQRISQVKTVRRTVLSESVGATSGRRCRSQDEASCILHIQHTDGPPYSCKEEMPSWYLLFALTLSEWTIRDSKASVPRCKRQRISQVKTVRRTVLSESVGATSDRRCRTQDEASCILHIQRTDGPPQQSKSEIVILGDCFGFFAFYRFTYCYRQGTLHLLPAYYLIPLFILALFL